MSPLVRISPITRINGFWNVEVEVNNGRVTDARSSGMIFRGFEKILQGRDPRDAIYLTERICGICSTVHGLAAAFAIEDALNIAVPENAVFLRNLIFGADLLQNHVRHFYLLSLVDFVEGMNIPPMIPRYQGGYRIPKSETDIMLRNYNDHFEIARKCHEMVVVFGGKIPHQHGIVAGGVSVHPDTSKVQKFVAMLEKVEEFITHKMLPDAERLAHYYADYYEIGKGHGNMMAYANFPTAPNQQKTVIPFGIVVNGRVKKFTEGRILEHLKYAWYQDAEPLPPEKGETKPDADKEAGYSWVKAPRYDGRPFETGPLAHLWVKGDYTRGISTMDRIMARVLEAKMVAALMKDWAKQLKQGQPIYRPFTFPDGEISGAGYHGAMRGALGHWVTIKDKRIAHYQIVTPSAWNCSPRDDNRVRGPVEEALIGTPVDDPDNPIEIGRVVRAFDPCLACAIHLLQPGRSMRTFRIIV
ncbi:MAG: nickel-dependent hydrogenase large subunit [Bacillota bacterium]